MNAPALVPRLDLSRLAGKLPPPLQDEPLMAPAEVLVVDDDEQVRDRLRLLLEGAGYLVRTAADGAEALESICQRYAPILVTESVMPRLNGQDLCRAIRSLPLPGYVYTIMLSVRDSPEDIVAGLIDGADDYLSKKAGRAELLARLQAGRRIAGLEQRLRHRLWETRQLANIDVHTGAYNARHVKDALRREIQRSVRYGHSISLLMCQLDPPDPATAVDAREARLRQFVARLANILPDGSDWIARWGEDLVLVVLPETGLDAAYGTAQQIRADLSGAPLSAGGDDTAIDVAIGIAGAGAASLKHGATVERLVELAEKCLVETHIRGRYRIVTRDYRPDHMLLRAARRTSLPPG